MELFIHTPPTTSLGIRLGCLDMLSKTDFWDNVSYRARKTAEENAAHDNWRNSLRDLHDASDGPDAETVFRNLVASKPD